MGGTGPRREYARSKEEERTRNGSIREEWKQEKHETKKQKKKKEVRKEGRRLKDGGQKEEKDKGE